MFANHRYVFELKIKGDANESDATNASANASAQASVDSWPTVG